MPKNLGEAQYTTVSLLNLSLPKSHILDKIRHSK